MDKQDRPKAICPRSIDVGHKNLSKLGVNTFGNKEILSCGERLMGLLI